MIRLSELGRTEDGVRVRLEGALTAGGLQVLRASLSAYWGEGIRSVRLEGDGIVQVDRLAMRDWPAVLPDGLAVRLTTSRRSLFQLLSSYGVEVEFTPSARDPSTSTGGD